MRDERARRRQAALFLSALLLLNAPVLAVVDRLGGLSPGAAPLTPAFLFGAWLLLILLCALNAGVAAPLQGRQRRSPPDVQG